MLIPKKKRIVDEAYRKSFKDSVCQASRDGINICGQPAIGAHINTEEYAGIGQKADDDLIFPLCHECHLAQHKDDNASWWLNNVLKPQARLRYRRFKQGEKINEKI